MSAGLVIEWSATFGGRSYDEARAVMETADGGFVAVGWTDVPGRAEDAFAVRVDAFGRREWERTYGGIGFDRFYSVVPAADGGLIMAGRSRERGSHHTAYLVQTDALGAVIQERQISIGRASGIRHVAPTSDGGLVVVGWTGRRLHSQSSDLLLFKVDAAGRLAWSHAHRQRFWQTGHQVVEAADGGFVVAGITRRGFGHLDGWIVKTDRDGLIEWTRRDGGRDWDEWHGVTATDDGVVVTGGTRRRGRFATWAMQLDLTGVPIWIQAYPDTQYAWGIMAMPGPAGGFAITGAARPPRGAGGSMDVFVRTIDPRGDGYDVVRLGGAACDQGRSVITTRDGCILVVGFQGREPGRCPGSTRQPAWDRDVLLVKLRPGVAAAAASPPS